MEGVNVELYFQKPLRCESRIDPQHVTSRPLRCYYRRSGRRSARKVVHLRRQLQKQQRINQESLPAALDEIKRLELELKYANKENAALKRELQEKDRATEPASIPLAENEPTIDGIERDDFMRAIRASLETIGKELELSTESDLEIDSLKAQGAPASGTVVSSESGAELEDVQLPQEEAVIPPAPNTAAESSTEDTPEQDKSLEDLMREEEQGLQEWIINFCQTQCYMTNNLESLVSISDRLGWFSAGIEAIIGKLCQAKEKELQTKFDELQIAKAAEARAKWEKVRENWQEERLNSMVRENAARRAASERESAAREAEFKITMEEDLKEKEAQLLVSMDTTLKTHEAEIRARLERDFAEKEIALQSDQQKFNARAISDVRTELETSFNEREVELRSSLDEEAEEKTTKALNDWKELYGPIIKLGAIIADRKLEKVLRPQNRDDSLIARANFAVHGGCLDADASRFHPSLPEDEVSNNREGFTRIYGVDPEFALKFGKCEKLAAMLNCRAAVKQYQRPDNKFNSFFARCDPLLKEVLKASSTEEIDQLLSEEENTETLAFLETECQRAMKQQKLERKEDYRQIAENKKLNLSTPLKASSSKSEAKSEETIW